MLRQQLWRLRSGWAGGVVAVHEVTASLVQTRHKARFAAETTVDSLLVLVVYLQQCVDVSFGVDLRRFGAVACLSELRNSGQTSLLDMFLELLAERLETLWYARKQRIHALQIFVLVVIKQFLEAFPHLLRMLANEDVLALADEALARVRIEISLDTIFLLAQTLFRLLQVVGDAVLGKELVGLFAVVFLSHVKERYLKVLLVNFVGHLVNITLVKTERNERINDFLDQTLIDCVAISLPLDQTKNSVCQLP